MHRLYGECDGHIQRIHEKLTEEKKIEIGYSTLTRLLREYEISRPPKRRCDQVPDIPGAEMQHDTTVYNHLVGLQKIKLVASVLYFRYSKIRYLKFYRSFNRFVMKCFFHEALTFWGYSAPKCIIDNTNLARLRGTGKNAVMVPEMVQFAKHYGFEFECHAKGHANRKAGNERSFYTVETNFLPGRTFDSLTDLNQQAFLWATERMTNRPVAKTHLIPAKAFEFEQAYLNKLPAYISPPYLALDRTTDQYGYISVDANFYHVPGNGRFTVIALLYATEVKAYHQRKLLAEYDRPPEGVKNLKVPPRGLTLPRHQPVYRKKPTENEEKILRALSGEVNDYLDFAIDCQGQTRHGFIRRLFRLYRKTTPPLFLKAVLRAHKYRITDVDTIERILVLEMRNETCKAPLCHIDQEFKNRDAYLTGRFSDEVDLTRYDAMMEDEDE